MTLQSKINKYNKQVQNYNKLSDVDKLDTKYSNLRENVKKCKDEVSDLLDMVNDTQKYLESDDIDQMDDIASLVNEIKNITDNIDNITDIEEKVKNYIRLVKLQNVLNKSMENHTLDVEEI